MKSANNRGGSQGTHMAPPRDPAARRQPRGRDYALRMATLLPAFAAAWVLSHMTGSALIPAVAFLAGVIVTAAVVLTRPGPPDWPSRLAIPSFDLAWISYALGAGQGSQGLWLALLYSLVATATVRGTSWESGTTLAGAITGVFVLLGCHGADTSGLLAAQAALLAAGVLAMRLSAATRRAPSATPERTIRFYDCLLEETESAVLMLSGDGWTVTEANRAASALFAQPGPAEQLIGQRLGDLLHLRDRAFLPACRSQLQTTGYVRGATAACRLRDGRMSSLAFSMVCADNDGRADRVQLVVSDADASADASSVLAGARGPDFSGHYIAALTDELNNHLAGIRLGMELSEATGRMPDRQAVKQQVDASQQALQTMVAQILEANAQQAPRSPATAPLSDLVEQSLLLTRPRILAHGIELQACFPPDALPMVQGHRYELEEALVRTILRCVDAAGSGEGEHVLSVTVRAHSDRVDILVEGLGHGLPWQELAAANGLVLHGDQHGHLTWAAVRGFVKHAGGSFLASNGLNGGARFRLTMVPQTSCPTPE